MAKEKNYQEEFGSNYKQRSKASIKAEIKYRTKRVNEMIKSTPKEILENPYVSQAINDLKILSGSKSNRIIANVSSSRTKESLIRQVRELKSYENWDIYSEQGQEKLNQRAKKAYQSFCNIKGRENIDEKDWNRMVEAFGALNSGTIDKPTSKKGEQLKKTVETMYDLISSGRSSNDFVDAWSYASEEGKIRFVDIWKDIEKEYEGKGATTFKIMEDFKKRVAEAGLNTKELS